MQDPWSRNRWFAVILGLTAVVLLMAAWLMPWGERGSGIAVRNSIERPKSEDSETVFRKTLKVDPSNVGALRGLAIVELDRGRLEDALALSQRLTKVAEGVLPGEELLARVYHAAGRRGEAIAHFRRVRELDPNLANLPEGQNYFWRDFGSDLLKEGRPDEAKAVLYHGYQRAGSPEIYDLLGQAFLDLGEKSAADDWWRLSSAANGGRIAPWLLRGRLALQENRLEDALEAFTRAMAFDPGSYEVLFSLGRIQRLMGHEEDAERYLKDAAEVQRSLPPSKSGMGATPDPAPIQNARPS